MSAIKTIQRSIAPELAEFETRFRDVMRTKVPLLDTIMYYMCPSFVNFT